MLFAGFFGFIGGGICLIIAIFLGLVGLGLIWKGVQCKGKSKEILFDMRHGYSPNASAGGCLGALAGGCLLPTIGLGVILGALLLAMKSLQWMGYM